MVEREKVEDCERELREDRDKTDNKGIKLTI